MPDTTALSASPLTTTTPWLNMGISRASFYRLKDPPAPVVLPGMKERRWRIADLEAWLARLKPTRKPGRRPIRKAADAQTAGE